MDFPQLKDDIYFDHAASIPVPRSILDNYTCDLTTNNYSNPHSSSTTSVYTRNRINNVKTRILNHFNTNSSEYSIVFTRNSTGALDLLSQLIEFKELDLYYHSFVHTSVLGN